jgi:leucine dehydrogenase
MIARFFEKHHLKKNAALINATRLARAMTISGAAHNVIAEPQAEQLLMERGILFVPDVVASAGAVIVGVGNSIMGLSDCSHLINRIGETADAILDEAIRSRKLPSEVAKEHASKRIAAAKKPDISFL